MKLFKSNQLLNVFVIVFPVVTVYTHQLTTLNSLVTPGCSWTCIACVLSGGGYNVYVCVKGGDAGEGNSAGGSDSGSILNLVGPLLGSSSGGGGGVSTPLHA